MSSDDRPPPPGPDHLPLVLRELGEAADLFQQVLADRLGLARSDLSVMGLLEARGPLTAGQIAEATALTTGAITGVLDRMERAGLARREPDPTDRRRVMVTLRRERLGRVAQLHEPLHRALHRLGERLSPSERRAISDYVLAAAAAFTAEARRLGAETRTRRPPEAAERSVTVPLGTARRGRLEVSAGASRLTLRGGAPAGALLAAAFEGTPPRVSVAGEVVTLAYARFSPFAWRRVAATVTLASTLPWEIEVRGGLARLEADLSAVRLARLEVRGGAEALAVALPRPTGTVPLRLTGGAAEVTFRRPPGTAARLKVIGGATSLAFDAQKLGAVAGAVVLETPGWDGHADRYEITITGGAAGVSVG